MSFELVDDYKVHNAIYENLHWDSFKDNRIYEKMMKSSDYFSLFCDWSSRSMQQVWIGYSFTDPAKAPKVSANFLNTSHITQDKMHPVKGMDPSGCVATGPGPWLEKVFHFLPDRPPSSAGNEVQSEYFVPYEHFRESLEELYKIKDTFAHLVQITECRMCKADNIPFSPAYKRDVVGIHWTWVRKH
jgi:xylitol oxidase